MLGNRTLMVPTYVWIATQVMKVLINLWLDRRLDFRYLVSAGGMPSSHSALVTSLAIAVGVQEGVGSPLFAVALVFATVVMYDAAGVRQAVGVQARILNYILDDLYAQRPISEKRLRELIGHTPIQVIVGALLGAGLTLLWL